MQIQDLKNKLVAIVGFGSKEGRATLEYLLRHGIKPVLFDQKPWAEWSKADQDYIKSKEVNAIFDPGYLGELRGFDVIFRNPAFPRLTPRLVEEEQKGTVITSQTKWFFDHAPATVVGVTGTKGKGTTSTLIHRILEAAGGKSYLTGNIGEIQPLEFLDDLTADDHVVYELSSFQLQDLHKSPHVSVVLMVTSEHLDHHKDVAEYREAKASITKFQNPSDIAIVNADYEGSLEVGNLGEARKLYFSRKQEVDDGCFVREGTIVYRDKKGYEAEVIKSSELQLRGEHNLENICAASLAGITMGIPLGTIQQVLRDFKGLEHRLEFVGEKNNIKFYNDSFSTTPETAIAAISSFKEPLVVILGGSSKNADFTELARKIVGSRNVKAVILIGEEGHRIAKSIQEAGDFRGRIMSGAASMAEIFWQTNTVANPGDVVLLSPACASFGMFKNYKDRGEQFREEFAKL